MDDAAAFTNSNEFKKSNGASDNTGNFNSNTQQSASSSANFNKPDNQPGGVMDAIFGATAAEQDKKKRRM
jgi:hypothetical protein